MTFDNFKIVQETYKELAAGTYDATKVSMTYRLLPKEFTVPKSTKNERVASIKCYFEEVFIKSIEKLLPKNEE